MENKLKGFRYEVTYINQDDNTKVEKEKGIIIASSYPEAIKQVCYFYSGTPSNPTNEEYIIGIDIYDMDYGTAGIITDSEMNEIVNDFN